MTYLYEEARRIEVDGHVIRLWINDQGFCTDQMVKDLYNQHRNNPLKYIATAIMDAVPSLNAIEIVNSTGTGPVVYRDWP